MEKDALMLFAIWTLTKEKRKTKQKKTRRIHKGRCFACNAKVFIEFIQQIAGHKI